MTEGFPLALAAMAVASFTCRAAGFALMRFVPVTPRLEAALRGIPLAVMLGIVAPFAVSGGPAELAGLGVTLLAMKLFGNDLAAALAGVATVALVRLALGT